MPSPTSEDRLLLCDEQEDEFWQAVYVAAVYAGRVPASAAVEADLAVIARRKRLLEH